MKKKKVYIYSWTCQLAPIVILSMHDKKKRKWQVHELAIKINCCGVHQMFLNYSVVKDTPNPLSPHLTSPHPPSPCSSPPKRVDLLRFPIRRPLQDAHDGEIKRRETRQKRTIKSIFFGQCRTLSILLEHCLKDLRTHPRCLSRWSYIDLSGGRGA